MPVWLALAAGILGGLLFAVLGRPELRAASIATYGSLLASFGVLTIGRPVIRAGGYKAWLEKTRIIIGGSFPPTLEETAEEAQELKDALAVQRIGPLLVVIGTMLNGVSGFFQSSN